MKITPISTSTKTLNLKKKRIFSLLKNTKPMKSITLKIWFPNERIADLQIQRFLNFHFKEKLEKLK